MIKTIVTIPNWAGTDGIEFIEPVMREWINNGKYSGRRSELLNEDTNTMVVQRWWWNDEETAYNYKALIEERFLSRYPDIQFEFVTE